MLPDPEPEPPPLLLITDGTIDPVELKLEPDDLLPLPLLDPLDDIELDKPETLAEIVGSVSLCVHAPSAT